MGARAIRTPEQRLRVFVSSTLGELADERRAVRAAISQLRLTPVMFETGARPHPPRALYRSYLQQSDVFVGVYWQRYGWIAPDMDISGLEDELLLSAGLPRLIYVKRPAPDMEPALAAMLQRLQAEGTTSYKPFRDAEELAELVLDDVALLLTERFSSTGDDRSTGPTRPASLPAPTSSFVGRAGDLRRLGELVTGGAQRLVTLTGPGGAGKTRLALEVARAVERRFPDGVHVVDLSRERESDRVLPEIVRAVAPMAASDEAPFDALVRGLHDRRMLLVLDNLEQVSGCGSDIGRLVQRCSQLVVLATSREALKVRDEVLYPVGPLALPTDATLPVGRALEVDAVRLLVDRASAAAPGFELDDGNVGDVIRICRRLDGLPLAIELAAARMRLFAADELRERIEQRLDELGDGARDLPERQQTLRRTIEWSTGLLDDDDRTVLAAFSIFAGGRLADVEAVLRSAPELAAVDLVGALGSLVDKSLLHTAPNASGRPRLSMLQTIRDHAGDLLAERPTLSAVLRRAHAERYAELARRWRGRMVAGRRAEALDELAEEHDNLRTAWSSFVEQGEVEPLDDLLEPLWGYYDAKGAYREAVALGDDLLAVLALKPASAERVRDEIAMGASLARSMIAVRGYTAEVEQAIGVALQRAGQSEETPRRFSALRALGTLHLLRADLPRSREIADELVAVAEHLGDPALLADAHQLAGISQVSVDVARGLGHLETSIDQFHSSRSSGLQFRVGPHPGVVSYVVSGLLLWLTGFPERAERRVERGLEVAAALGHPYTSAYAGFHASLLSLWQGRLDQLAERTDELRAVAEAHDYPVWRALSLVMGGTARIGGGAAEEGLREVARGFDLYQGLSTPPVFWRGLLLVRAHGCLMAGRLDEAGRHLDAALAAGWDGDPQEAEIEVVRGDLLLARGGDAAQAAAHFSRGADVAGRRGVRMSRLVALTRLVEVSRGTPHEVPARAALAAAVADFTEGFTSPPLVAAQAALHGR